jgi:hypothetical protein
MAHLFLALSMLSHAFFFATVGLDAGPRHANPYWTPGDRLRLLGVEAFTALCIIIAVMSESGTFAGWTAVPVAVAHWFGVKFFRARRDAPRGTPGFRRFEDMLYAGHAVLAPVALGLFWRTR